MLQLPNVTLCCVDAKHHAMAVRALDRCRRDICFARTLFFTDAVPSNISLPEGIDVIPTGPIMSHEEYSRIVLKRLFPHVATSHVLVVQWDGYVAHPELWMDEFLDCDYVGAPWPDGKGGYTVGNGGFSLRSRKLLAALQDARFPLLTSTEDVTICALYRPCLESDFGIRFGSPDLARWFSFEMDACDAIMGQKTFGFHGIFNLFLVESEQEIVTIAPLLSDAIVCSDMTALLFENLIKFRQFDAALALAWRMLKANPERTDVANAVERVRRQLDSRCASVTKEKRIGVASRILQKILLR